MRFALFIFLPALLPGIIGQTVSGIPNISVDVNLVLLHPVVRDRHGEFVSALSKNDFQVFENGQPQTIAFFQHADTPVSVGLLVDNSGSMGPKRKDVTAAAVAFAASSNPGDEMFVVNFNEKVTLGLPDRKLFSASVPELEAALNGVPASGRTAIYDAIETGLAHVRKAHLDNKVLILISDGGDNASRHTRKEVLRDAARSNAIIYAIGLLDEEDGDEDPRFLNRIARVTGGEAFFPQKTSEVTDICKRIAKDIREQYTIGYAPTDAKLDDTYRRIKVTARDAHRGPLSVRTRAGYIASPAADSRPANESETSR